MNEKKYRIVMSMDGTWCVQEFDEKSIFINWNLCHVCKEKNEEGYYEAKKWMEENL